MGREKTNIFMVNGKPMLAPDATIPINYEDIDSPKSGRLKNGVMYRVVIRYKVPSWNFQYSNISEEDKQYLESIFPDAPDFLFTHPDRHDSSKSVTTRCYRSKYGIAWKDAETGEWKNYKFNIIEC